MRGVSDILSLATNGSQNYTNGSSVVSSFSSHSRDTTNGFSHVNGSSLGSQANGMGKGKGKEQQYFGHDRQEVTRLMIQALGDLGYTESAGRLAQESGYDLESPVVAALRYAILNGEWAEAEALLIGVRRSSSRKASVAKDQVPVAHGLPLAEGVNKQELLFKLRRQKYLELLERRDQGAALVSLQQELTPIHRDPTQLHQLSGLMVCSSIDELKEQAGWDGAEGTSREKLLAELSVFIAPSVMIPNHRLAMLLDQVRQGQILRCHYHNPTSRPTLFADHICDRSQFPLQTIRQLSQAEQIWYLAYSPDGKMLATSGRTTSVIVYDTDEYRERYVLSDHAKPVTYISWSPDSSRLISCSFDNRAKVWDVQGSRVICTIINHKDPVTSAVWFPDGSSFITSSLDRYSPINTWTSNGDFEYKWPAQHRSQALAISPDGERLVSVSPDRQVFVYRVRTRQEEYSMMLRSKLTSINISRDSRFILVNLTDNELQLIDIGTAKIVQRFLGQKQGAYMIKSTFGGADENLVISGSQDFKVYIFHRERGTIIETLEGHTGCVNAIAWHPTDPCMFASASDDKRVRIWSKPSASPALSQGSGTSPHSFGSNTGATL